MAYPTNVTLGRDAAAIRGDELRQQHNKLVDDVRVLQAGLAALAAAYNLALAKLDADGGVTDTDYASTKAVTTTTYNADTDMTAAKVVR